MSKYLNIYAIAQAYGGPEEGGWWYSSGDPIDSTKVTNLTRATKDCDSLNKRFSKTNQYSMGFGEHDGVDSDGFGDDKYLIKGGRWGDTKLTAIIQDHPAEAFPQERPYYE